VTASWGFSVSRCLGSPVSRGLSLIYQSVAGHKIQIDARPVKACELNLRRGIDKDLPHRPSSQQSYIN